MARRYFVDELPAAGGVVLTGEVAHHLATVLRMQPGDQIVLADGKGRQCEARIERAGGGKVAMQAGVVVAQPRPASRLWVAFAPPKWTRADWLFEHGTEVGIDVFVPLWTERTRPQGGRADRWQKLVRAAAGQCDRGWLPEVRNVTEFADFVADPGLPAQRFLASGGASAAPAMLTGDAVLLVGPEGGFTAAEQALANGRGFSPIGLGPYVLRTETAAMVGASALVLAASRATGTPVPRS